ncbi:uncharacterized protein LOC134821255 [Bolinopsis microptera]|uniref:uncharacterized protein LOC134821255 n=1 Tax=Bolinopsis microptera TaxID=2820187 RepID=UPI00307AC093
MIMFLALTLLVTMVTVTAASEDLEMLEKTAEDIRHLSPGSRNLFWVIPHIDNLIREFECEREATSCKAWQANTMLMKLEFGLVNCESVSLLEVDSELCQDAREFLGDDKAELSDDDIKQGLIASFDHDVIYTDEYFDLVNAVSFAMGNYICKKDPESCDIIRQAKKDSKEFEEKTKARRRV